jgi:hypothetical protein
MSTGESSCSQTGFSGWGDKIVVIFDWINLVCRAAQTLGQGRASAHGGATALQGSEYAVKRAAGNVAKGSGVASKKTTFIERMCAKMPKFGILWNRLGRSTSGMTPSCNLHGCNCIGFPLDQYRRFFWFGIWIPPIGSDCNKESFKLQTTDFDGSDSCIKMGSKANPFSRQAGGVCVFLQVGRVDKGFTPLGGTDDPQATDLEACIGKCDNDSQCKEGLKCFLRDGLAPVPGCSGNGKRGWDYCYDPTEEGREQLLRSRGKKSAIVPGTGGVKFSTTLLDYFKPYAASFPLLLGAMEWVQKFVHVIGFGFSSDWSLKMDLVANGSPPLLINARRRKTDLVGHEDGSAQTQYEYDKEYFWNCNEHHESNFKGEITGLNQNIQGGQGERNPYACAQLYANIWVGLCMDPKVMRKKNRPWNQPGPEVADPSKEETMTSGPGSDQEALVKNPAEYKESRDEDGTVISPRAKKIQGKDEA